MENIRRQYESRQRRYNKLLQKQKEAEALISNLRLWVFIIGAAVAAFMLYQGSYLLLMTSLLVFLAAFIYLVVRHGRLIKRIKYTEVLININARSLQRLNGQWNTFAEDGEAFADDNHSYSGDLDIFGIGSLFQWISVANTYIGKEKLKGLLSGVAGGHQDILNRQMAISELSKMLNWRQRFFAEGLVASEKMHNPEDLKNWTQENIELFRLPWVIAVLRICPVITVFLVLAGFIIHIIPWYWPALALMIQFGLLSYKAKERLRMFAINERYSNDLRIYYKMLKRLEVYPFQSVQMQGIQHEMKSKEGLQAYKQLDQLSTIIDSVSDRKNMLYFFFNILTMWDFQNMIAIESWKLKSGQFLMDWLEALGRVEALASLAIIRFENPDWAMPVFCNEKEAAFEAKGMGHPLLTGERVYNSLDIKDQTKVLLITGSNMSGKSTLLRTAGINLVLAYAGAPVCASYMRASIMEIYTCMRVRDNLGESVSSFYAELLRIKKIVSEAKSGKPIFFLLDEIFKGTNSVDRHAGARVLINELSLTQSIGMVSTHDLELCDLAQVNESIENYHFKEYYEDGKICFDYKLRKGPSTTRNALYLMRLAGIDVEEGGI